MTEHEAEALMARLTRIWQQNADQEARVYQSSRKRLLGEIPVQEGVRLVLSSAWWMLQAYRSEEGLTGTLTFNFKTEQVYVLPEGSDRELYPLFDLFAKRWVPFFRRGCWLSGCPIEASAHEKAEWIQGFTREELAAWGLKV